MMPNHIYQKVQLSLEGLFTIVVLLPMRLKRLLHHIFYGFPTIRYYYRTLSFTSTLWYWCLELFCCFSECIGIADLYEIGMLWSKINTRPLEDWEIRMAKSVFGNSIHYSKIKIDESAHIGTKKYQVCYVSFNTINSWKGMSNSTLIHELVHVWQYQKLGTVYIPRALHAQFQKPGYNYGGVEKLKEVKDKNGHFLQFNYEQQGDIVADYYRIKSGQIPRWGNGSLTDIDIYEYFIQQLRNYG